MMKFTQFQPDPLNLSLAIMTTRTIFVFFLLLEISVPIWLVVWLPFFIFPYIGLLIIPIDFHIFQRGGPTTNHQPVFFVAVDTGSQSHLCSCLRASIPDPSSKFPQLKDELFVLPCLVETRKLIDFPKVFLPTKWIHGCCSCR